MSYTVKEIFYTLQGEGANTGRPAVFCRFSGCNLWSGLEKDRAGGCSAWCDTDFHGGDSITADALAGRMSGMWPQAGGSKFCVLTGGEPTLQLIKDRDLAYSLRRHGFTVAIETNGTHPVPFRCVDWITVSPKAGSHLVQRSGHELKVVWPQPINLEDFETLDFKHFFLSPMWSSSAEGRGKAQAQVVEYCLAHPKWRVSLQTHKLLGVR